MILNDLEDTKDKLSLPHLHLVRDSVGDFISKMIKCECTPLQNHNED